MAKPRIFVVEDEPKLAALLRDYLEAAGYDTRIFTDGGPVVETVRRDQPALVLLDVMLPGKNGLDICREVRSFSSLPIILITARVEEVDRLWGLELGADDYICKPFSPREVVARVKAVMRRAYPEQAAPVPGLVIDEEGFCAFFDGKDLDLTPVEFRLLSILVQGRGKVFSRDQLLTALHDDQRVVTDRTVDTHIKNLRKKLQAVEPGRELIQSIYGVGYKLNPGGGE